MLQKIEEIRELIRKDEIEKALEKTKSSVSSESLNIIILISNRYHKWKKEKLLGIGDDFRLRNSTINDLLNVLEDEETKIGLLTKNVSNRNSFDTNYTSSSNTVIQNKVNAQEDKRCQVFISYSHKDKKYLEDLQRHFKPLADRVHFWSDKSIEAGQKWNDTIKSQISKAKIAILLISADFFNSDFIIQDELPPLLKAAESNGTKILSIILKPCFLDEFPEISQYQTINDPSKPISGEDETSKELIWVKLVRTVKKIISE